jgi:hypothetical protein
LLLEGLADGCDGGGDGVEFVDEVVVGEFDLGAVGFGLADEGPGGVDAGDGEIVAEEGLDVTDIGEPWAEEIARFDGDAADIAEVLFEGCLALFGEGACVGVVDGGDLLLPLFEEEFAFGAHVVGAAEGGLIGFFDVIDGASEFAVGRTWIDVGLVDEFIEGGGSGVDGLLDGSGLIAVGKDPIAGAFGLMVSLGCATGGKDEGDGEERGEDEPVGGAEIWFHGRSG